MVDNATERKREYDGRYAYDGNLDRLCVCGHTLGVHGGGSPADCLLYSFSGEDKKADSDVMKAQGDPDVDCGCVKFRLSRKKREADHA